MAKLVCGHCGRPLAECCDLFEEAQDADGNDCVLCYNCLAELGFDLGENVASGTTEE